MVVPFTLSLMEIPPPAVCDCRRAGGVRADVVALDDRSGCVGADLDARSVTRDDVPREAGAADSRIDGAHDVHADAAIGKRCRAGRVRPDEIALDDVADRRVADNRDGMLRVAGNDVGRAGHRAANRVVRRAGVHEHTALNSLIRQRRRTGGGRPDVVALDEVLTGRGVLNQDAGALVAGDDVPRGSRRPSDTVVGRVDADAGSVRARERPADVSADVVAFDDVPAAREDGDSARG